MQKHMSYAQQFFKFWVDIFVSRQLIMKLAKQDFKTKYLGSYLGIMWAFIQPTITVTIFWFVFQVGFKVMPVGDFPFILWLLCGIIPWFFITEALSNATSAVIENSYLVSKIVFRISILPIVKIVSSLFVHLFFIMVVFIMFYVYGYTPSIYNIQVIYYLLATIILLLGFSWITSALIVFFKDVGQIIAMFLQFGFWLTPIFWSITIVPEKYRYFFKLNPLYYIVEGYRETFIYHKWFWEHKYLTPYFWLVALTVFIIGALIFKKLRPHFADVL